jgi:hypothetical protein
MQTVSKHAICSTAVALLCCQAVVEAQPVAYPAKGQSPQQQQQDHAACSSCCGRRRWDSGGWRTRTPQSAQRAGVGPSPEPECSGRFRSGLFRLYARPWVFDVVKVTSHATARAGHGGKKLRINDAQRRAYIIYTSACTIR